MILDLLDFPTFFNLKMYQVQGGIAVELSILIAIKLTMYILND
jgi:hypothetical protein